MKIFYKICILIKIEAFYKKIKKRTTTVEELTNILKFLKINNIIYRFMIKKIKHKIQNLSEIEKKILLEYTNEEKKYIEKIKNDEYTLYVYKNKKTYYCEKLTNQIKSIIKNNNIKTIYINKKKVDFFDNINYTKFNFTILI